MSVINDILSIQKFSSIVNTSYMSATNLLGAIYYIQMVRNIYNASVLYYNSDQSLGEETH